MKYLGTWVKLLLCLLLSLEAWPSEADGLESEVVSSFSLANACGLPSYDIVTFCSYLGILSSAD